ncbi:MAG: type III pantothenate kinase [Rhodospirillaceae bacterium]|nr:type III pantothenate kinase [Rhodospirillaceae bacterium]
MLLAINANNTLTKFALYDGDTARGNWRLATQPARTADEYFVWLAQLMALAGEDRAAIDAAIIATVVPPSLFHLKQLCRQHFGCEPLVVGESDVKLGMNVRLDRPQEVGADRLANAVGGHLAHPGALIVVDFGTATTFDVIADNGDYCGGAIAPGVQLSLEVLHSATAKLPRIDVERPAKAIGTDTLTAMQSGIFWGYIGLIEGLIARMRAEWPGPMTIVATGGLAPLFFGATDALEYLDPDLTMRGLVEIHRRNKGGRRA